MKTKCTQFLVGVILMSSLLVIGCIQSESDLIDDNQKTPAIPTDSSIKFIKNSDFDNDGYYTISSEGVYKFAEDIGDLSNRKAIFVTVKANEKVVLDGADKKLYGKCTYNEKGDNNVILCTGSGEVNIKDLTIYGDGSNAIRIGDGLKASCTVVDVRIENPPNSTNRPGDSGGGGIEIGKGSFSNCEIKSGDDAIKVSEPGASAKNVKVEMQGNGSAIQFGYGTRCDGAGHKVSDVTISGFTNLDKGEKNETCIPPNYAAIGGNFANKGISDIVTENIKIYNSDKFRYLVKLVVFEDCDVTGLNINAECLNGINVNTYTNAEGKTFLFHPIVIVVKAGAIIKGKITLTGEKVPDENGIGEFVRLEKDPSSIVDLTINGKKYE